MSGHVNQDSEVLSHFELEVLSHFELLEQLYPQLQPDRNISRMSNEQEAIKKEEHKERIRVLNSLIERAEKSWSIPESCKTPKLTKEQDRLEKEHKSDIISKRRAAKRQRERDENENENENGNENERM